MQEYSILIVVAVTILGYGLFSARLQRTILTGPMVFVLVGLALSHVWFQDLSAQISLDMTMILAEVTLVLVLFTDATHIHVRDLLHDRIPARLLGIGLPIMILLGWIAAYLLFPGMVASEALILAILLTPTDAALGKAVVLIPEIPEHEREGLVTEAGFNDGFTLPILLIALTFTPGAMAEERNGWIGALLLILQQIGVGVLVGVAVGWGGGKLVQLSADKGWMADTYQRLAAIGLALLAYILAEVTWGNGLVATFSAGLALATQTKQVRERMMSFGEAEGEQLSLLTFLLFGALMIPAAYPYWDWRALLYALLSLTLLRMSSVALALIGSRERLSTVLFLGWFGPRGIASILFILVVLSRFAERDGFSFSPYPIAVVVLTVFLSVLLHGVTAHPLAKRYARLLQD